MKKHLLFILMLLGFTKSFAQEKINYKYFNLDSIEITKKENDAWRENKNQVIPAYFKISNDTIFTKWTKRTVIGLMTDREAKQFITIFSPDKESIEYTKPTLIQLFQGSDPCFNTSWMKPNDWDLRDKGLENKLSSKYTIKIFNVYSPDADIQKRTELSELWVKDKYAILNKFFPLHYGCGSFMILKPNGEYFIYYGEYSDEIVITSIKKMKIK